MADTLTLRQKILRDEYRTLNDMQQQAVFATDGPLLILAGAGSGKTTVIVYKIGYLIRYGSIESDTTPLPAEDESFLSACLEDRSLRCGERYWQLMQRDPIPARHILAITFTNKAAAEMRTRLEQQFNIQSDELWALTFHSLCVRLLRRYINLLGFDTDFTIYDETDSLKLLEACAKQLECGDQYPAKLVKRIISNAKTRYLDPDEFEAQFKERSLPKMPKLYRLYQQSLQQSNALDFDDLIFYTVRVLTQHPEIRERVNDRFRYVLVDEYQDTNPLQYRLVALLAAHGNICVVGDDDQSIYRFMGADVDNILSFERSFSRAQVIRLEQNYRSTGIILEAANSVIAHNVARKGKTLWTAQEGGAKITYNQLSSNNEEAEYIAKTILAGIGTKNMQYNDFCVLYRTHGQSNSIEFALKGNGIPYKVYGGLAFLKRKEIQDILAYLNVCHNPADKTRLLRIINEPRRGIGDTTMQRVEEIAAAENTTLFEILSRAGEYPALSRVKEKLEQFARMIEDLRQQQSQLSLPEFYLYLLQTTGYMDMINGLDILEKAARKDNLQEFYNTIVTFTQQNQGATLQSFLEEMALVSAVDNLDENEQTVTLMTMHCAKGLEFDTVFVCGFDEGIFPSARSVEEPGGLEEERRLCYVAITRAKRRLFLLSAKTRMMYGSVRSCFPSRFLKEIPEHLYIQPQKELQQQRQQQPSPSQRPKRQPYRFFEDSGSVVPQHNNPPAQSTYRVGMRVRHKTFGDGQITAVTAMSSDTLLEVRFDSGTSKKLMANFAKMEILT